MCVVGPVSVRVYTGNDGVTRAQLEVQGDEVEFLSPANSDGGKKAADEPAGYTMVETDELPF